MSNTWNKIFLKLTEPYVSEVDCNAWDSLFYKEKGVRKKFDFTFESERDYEESTKEVIPKYTKSFRPYDPQGYIFEGPLKFRAKDVNVQGRCHIVLPPACNTPQITIAKKTTTLLDLDSIMNSGSMAPEMCSLLKLAINARLGVVLSGQTGAGKTTMLEALTKHIPEDDRIGIAEDSPELKLIQPNATYYNSVPWSPGMDPNSVATLSWCVAQFNRARLDRMIIGETRGKEFYDFLVAANSGISGCITTIHANTPSQCLDKMTGFALDGSPQSPLKFINTMICTAVDLIVQLSIVDGKHRIGSIYEVTNTVANTAEASITIQPLYQYDGAKDEFIKKDLMTDVLRAKIVQNGEDYSPFMANWSGPVKANDILGMNKGHGEKPSASTVPVTKPAGRSGLPGFGNRSI